MRKLILILLFTLLSCDELVNTISFFPDKNISIPAEYLPSYMHIVEIKTFDNLTIQGLYLSKKKPDDTSHLILYFHGNAGNMYHRINEAKNLYEMGFDILVVSYRGYAQSRGSPSENGIYIDGKSSLFFAVKELGYTVSNIIIYGRSLGSAVAIEVAQHKKISKMILISPLSSGIKYAESKGLGCLAFMADTPFNSIDKLDNISCPLLIIHGDKDEVVMYHLGRTLYEKYKGTKQFVTIPGGGHNDLEYVNPQLFWSSVKNFLY